MITLLLSLVLSTSTPNHLETLYAQSNQEIIDTGIVSAATTQTILEAEFGPENPMIDVAWCESSLRQFDSSDHVLRGYVTPADRGLFQINADWHEDTGEHNVYSLRGNIQYAKELYMRNGTRDWNASKACWGKQPITSKA